MVAASIVVVDGVFGLLLEARFASKARFITEGEILFRHLTHTT